MKKLLTLVLALMLLCGVAMADVVDFGDFSMDLDPATMAAHYEKQEAQVFLNLFPNYDENADSHPNINVIWQEDVIDIAAQDPQEVAEVLMNEIYPGLESQGIKVSNVTLLGADHDEHEGVPALSVVYTYDVDYSGMGVDKQMTLFVAETFISQPGVGTYIFTCTAADLEGLQSLIDVLNTIKWNF